MAAVTDNAGADSDFRGWIAWCRFDGMASLAFLRAYFDESERPRAGTLVISGCLFALPQVIAFRRDWSEVFGQFGGCHMTDLVAGQPPYDKLSQDERRAMVRRATEIMIERVEVSRTVVANINDLQNGPPVAFALRKAYGICAEAAVRMIEEWLDQEGRVYGSVQYVFEAGYTRPGARAEFRAYAEDWHAAFWRHARGYAVVPKTPCSPFEACDIAAWEVGKYYEEQGGIGDPVRGSLRALFESGKFYWLEETREALQAYQDALRADAKERDATGRTAALEGGSDASSAAGESERPDASERE